MNITAVGKYDVLFICTRALVIPQYLSMNIATRELEGMKSFYTLFKLRKISRDTLVFILFYLGIHRKVFEYRNQR